MYAKLTNYTDALNQLDIRLNDNSLSNLKKIEQQGWTERSICFAISKSLDKLTKYRRDNRFWSILLNEVRKHSFKINDPRWEEVNKKRIDAENLKKDMDADKHRMELLKELKSVSNGKCKTMVYFIQSVNGGPIKIGYSNNVNERIRELQTASPYKLILLAAIVGGVRMENDIHKQFSKYRMRGEWFKPAKELMEFINKHKYSVS